MQDKCLKYLEQEIKSIKPKKIAVFGGFPRKSLKKIYGRNQIGKYEGKILIDSQIIEIKRFYHYSNIFFNPRGKNDVKQRYGSFSGWIKDVVDFIA